MCNVPLGYWMNFPLRFTSGVFDWSKTHVLSEYKTQKNRVLLFFASLPLYRKANKEA